MNLRIIPQKLAKIIKKDPLFSSLVLLIIAIAIFFRTYNYLDRIYLIADNSRDVQIATYAKDHLLVPPIGQFSSAGPFFYGPWYYWFLEAVSLIPFGLLTHWLAITTIYFLFIYLIYWVGSKIENKWLGLLCAAFAAISPAQINFSTSVWNPAIIPILTLTTIILLFKFVQRGKPIYILLLSFVCSLAFTIHFQSILILPTILVALFSQKTKLKVFFLNLFLVFLGFLIPLLPLIYFDIKHEWYNAKSLFIYLAIDQYSIWVPNRWLTYTTSYWPEAWAYIIGGSKLISGVIIFTLGLLTLSKLKSFSKNRLFLLLAITFAFEVLLYRYYRGPRFIYYSLFAHPYILILTGYLTFQLIKLNKAAGFFILIAISIFTLNVALQDLKDRGVTLKELTSLKNEIYKNYPSASFDIYGCQFNAETVSHPLALLMYKDGRNSTKGTKIGVCESNNDLTWTEISDKDLDREKPFWYNRTTERVYFDAQEWWRKKQPQKSDFIKFLKEKLSPKCYPHC